MSWRALLLIVTMTLTLIVAGGTAMAETGNGPIYYVDGFGLKSVDPTASNPEPTILGPWSSLEDGQYEGMDTFDVSRDRGLLVFEPNCPANYLNCSPEDDPLGPYFYTIPRGPDGTYFNQPQRQVQITNRWACEPNCRTQVTTEVTLSPDSETIYFAGERVLAPDDIPTGIYSVPTEGGAATRVPIEESDGAVLGIDGSASFALSPDGSTLAFGAKPEGEDAGIFTVPVGGGVPTRVTDEGCRDYARSPSFSPDGDTIIYVSPIWSGDDCSGTSHRTLYTTPADNDGTSPGTPLFPEDATDTVPSYRLSKWYPVYSPDGKRISFGNNSSSGAWKLATAAATGGSVSTFGGCLGCRPLWLAKPLDTSITSVTSRRSGASVTSSVAFSSNDDEATFECKLDDGTFEACASPKEYPGLAEGSSHTVEVRAIGPAGNADPTPARRTWTVDATAPTIVGVSPTDGSTGVGLNTKVEATFSEDINWSYTYFTLTEQGSSNPVAWSSIRYDSRTHKATLDPASNLEVDTTYTATIEGGSTGAKDQAGNALAQDYAWTFTATPCTKTGTANAENISGTSGDDFICASGGNDTIRGLGGNDTLKGEDGNDKLLGGVGDDTLDGGPGTDTASYWASLTAVVASLETGSATGEGSDNFGRVENLLGSPKADTLTGSAANNTLTGGDGGDTERGGSGNDTVVGNGGADTLKGEVGSDAVKSRDGVSGNDSLDGGAGTDTKMTDPTEKSIVGFP